VACEVAARVDEHRAAHTGDHQQHQGGQPVDAPGQRDAQRRDPLDGPGQRQVEAKKPKQLDLIGGVNNGM
jgi:hypothetical protein